MAPVARYQERTDDDARSPAIRAAASRRRIDCSQAEEAPRAPAARPRRGTLRDPQEWERSRGRHRV